MQRLYWHWPSSDLHSPVDKEVDFTILCDPLPPTCSINPLLDEESALPQGVVCKTLLIQSKQLPPKQDAQPSGADAGHQISEHHTQPPAVPCIKPSSAKDHSILPSHTLCHPRFMIRMSSLAWVFHATKFILAALVDLTRPISY